MTIARQFSLFIQVLSLAVCGSVFGDTSTTSKAQATQITEADCIDFINERSARISCGFIELPLDHDKPGKQTISLPVLIARQTQKQSLEPSNKSILIPGGGGPGGSMGFGYEYQAGNFLKEFASLRAAGFDIVILDQRGAGFSKPNLRCIETNRAFKQIIVQHVGFAKELQIYKDAIDQCATRMQNDNIALSQFDTYQSAKDFLATMDSLSYQSWSVLATSYATVIAQAIEVIRPRAFDYIVLDSPVPIDYQRPSTIEAAKESITRILTLCERTQRCNKKHPNITSKFSEVLDKAKNKPYSVSVRVFDNSLSLQRNLELVVSDSTLIEVLMNAAYSNYSIADIPWLIDRLHKNKPRALQKYTQDYWYTATDLDFADGLSWAVHCKERRPLEDRYLKRNPEKAAALSDNSKNALKQERQICEKINVGLDSHIKTDKLFTSRALILAGDLDPVISRNDIHNTANNFSDVKTIIMPGMGHSVWYQSKCARAKVLEFFTAATASDSSCKDGLTRFK